MIERIIINKCKNGWLVTVENETQSITNTQWIYTNIHDLTEFLKTLFKEEK